MESESSHRLNVKAVYKKEENGVPEAEIKRLTQQLADVHAAQEKNFINWKATKDAVATKKVAEREVLILTQELGKMRNSHSQPLLARNAETVNLKVQLARARKKAEDAEYEIDGAKARL